MNVGAVNDTIGIAVLRKAMAMEKQQAQMVVENLRQVAQMQSSRSPAPTGSTPPSGNLDLYA